MRQGGNAYLVRYHGPDGKTHSRQFPKKVDADRFAASTEVAKNDGSWIDPGGGKVLLSEWVEHWTPTQVHLRPSSRARDQTYLDTHILPRFGTLPISNIRNADIRAWVAELTAAGYAPATVAKGKQILSKILQAAVDDRRLPFNPADRVPVPRIEREEMRYLTPPRSTRSPTRSTLAIAASCSSGPTEASVSARCSGCDGGVSTCSDAG